MSEHEPGDRDERELGDRGPIDLPAVQYDDALLDALGSADPDLPADATELDTLLLAWRREVDSEPLPELVDTDTAMYTMRAAALAGRRSGTPVRWKILAPVAVAASVLGVAFAGAGIAAQDAQPGDALWTVTKVIYTDKARSVEAATEVRGEFDLARSAISEGQLDDARSALDDARTALDAVHLEEHRSELLQQHQELMTRLDENELDAPETGAPPAEAPPAVETRTETVAPPAEEPPAAETETETEKRTTVPSPTETTPSPSPTETTERSPSPSPTETTEGDTGTETETSPRSGNAHPGSGTTGSNGEGSEGATDDETGSSEGDADPGDADDADADDEE